MHATFAAGSFDKAAAAFRRLRGVTCAAAGYMGGTHEHPTAFDVSTGMTGHAEVVHLEYDPRLVTYDDLLQVFWECHDPTTLNRQGFDIGPQYRSAIFFHTAEQQQAAAASKSQRAGSSRQARPIVTRIEPAQTFWPAQTQPPCGLESRTRSRCASE